MELPAGSYGCCSPSSHREPRQGGNESAHGVKGETCKTARLHTSNGAPQRPHDHLTFPGPSCSGLDHDLSKGMALVCCASIYRGLGSMTKERGDGSWASATKCSSAPPNRSPKALWVTRCRRAGDSDESCTCVQPCCSQLLWGCACFSVARRFLTMGKVPLLHFLNLIQ